MEVTESGVLTLPFAASSVGVARRRLVSDLTAAAQMNKIKIKKNFTKKNKNLT
jgi:hypothetical protein